MLSLCVSLLHAAALSAAMLSNSTPSERNSWLLCRSTTCDTQPLQPGPMLKYSSTGIRPRN